MICSQMHLLFSFSQVYSFLPFKIGDFALIIENDIPYHSINNKTA